MKKFLLFASALLCNMAMVFAQTYVVTGANTAIFGTAWDNNSACVLEKQTDGSYAWTKTDVELPAGQVEYKMLEKGTWDGWQLPVQGNASFNIDKSGKYDITFTLSADLSAQNAVPTLKEEVAIVPTIILHGTFSNPNWGDSDPFVYNADNSVATLTLALEAQTTYEFGMKFDGAWKANGAEITSANNSTNLGEGSGNMKMTTTVAGNYVFTYTAATQVLAVAYPGGGDDPVDPIDPVTGTYGIGSNLNSWTPTADPMTVTNGVATCKIQLGMEEFQFSVVEDGTWLKNLEAPITRENNTVVLSAIDSYDNCVLTPDQEGEYTFNFTIATKTLEVLFPNQGQGISNVGQQADFTKIIRNGQVLIIRDGVAYNMMGQEVK